MDKINGFTIVAYRWSDSTHEDYIILGVRHDGNTFEYVTAAIQHLTDRSWYWGHYFNTADHGSIAVFGKAVEDFQTR